MNIETVRRLIREECHRLGGENEFARAAGVTRQLVNATANGRRPPRGKILDALGLELVEIYQKKPTR